MDKTTFKLKFENEGDSEEYEVEAICKSTVYAKELEIGHHLPGLYYLVSWKGYLEKENTWEPALVVLHLCKLISTFYCDYPEKSIATFLLIESALPMARPTVKSKVEASNKQKQGRPAKDSSASKYGKKI